MRPVLWALLSALLILPGAAAALGFEVTSSPTAPLAPETGLGTIAWTATVDCSDLVVAATGLPEGEAILRVDPQTAATVVLAGPQAHTVDGRRCLNDPADVLTLKDAFAVSISRHAAAGEPLPILLNATLERSDAGTGTQEDLQADAETAVTPAPFFQIRLQVDTKIQETAGGPVSFEVVATNFGNAPVDLTFELVDGPQSEAMQAWFQGVEPVRLEWSGGASGQTAVTQARFQVPDAGARTNEQAAFTITATPTTDGQSGDPMTFNVLIRHRGHLLSQDGPGPGTLLLVPALAAIAIALHRRR